jgi:tetratricopeptide (TPR) repeat protein
MPLLPFALVEKWRIAEARRDSESAKTAWQRWQLSIPRDAQYYLDVASWYHDIGDWASSDALLQKARKDFAHQSVSPLVYYYLASNAAHEGRDSIADGYFTEAGSAPYEKVFPNRVSDAQVLMEAVTHNSKDSNAKYLLGNFLFARGAYDDAFKVWLEAQEQGFSASVLERNLGLYAWRVKQDLESAASFYEKAIGLAPNDFHLYADLDEIYCQMGDRTKREKLFAAAPTAVLDRDLLRVRRARLLIEQKQYDQAVETLGNHDFKSWEATASVRWDKTDVVREVYAFANLKKGLAKLKEGKLPEAEQAFRAALEYPANFNVGGADKPNDERALYWLGKTLKAQGRESEAREVWQQAAALGKEKSGISKVFAALSLRELGDNEQAETILTGLAQVPTNEKVDAGDLYAAGVLDLLENRNAEARSNFRRALQLDPFLWPARLEAEEADSST